MLGRQWKNKNVVCIVLTLTLCILLCLPSPAVFAQEDTEPDAVHVDNNEDTSLDSTGEESIISLPDSNENVLENNLTEDSDEASLPSVSANGNLEDESLEDAASSAGISLFSTTYDMGSGPLYIAASDGDLTITGTYLVTGVDHAIEIEAGYNGTITLDNVTIDMSANYDNAAFLINGSGNVNSVDTYVNVELVGTNYLTSGYKRAGLEVWAGGQVEIGGTGTLYAECANSSSYNSSGAGIGAGDVSGSGGNIVIRSGNIYATAGYHGAGIGGSWTTAGAYNGTIIIYGGHVVSNGGLHGAGIGGGCANSLFHQPNTGTILVLPPADVSASSGGAYETVGEMNTTVYIGDPRSPVTTVRTSEYTAGADIYMNLINVTEAISALQQCNVSTSEVDLTHIKLGTTDSNGIASIHMEVDQSVNFYTDATATSGLNFQSYETTATEDQEIVLNAPLLNLTANNLTTSVPDLKSGYTTVPAENYQTIELINSGDLTITNITLVIAAPYDNLFEIVSIDKVSLSPGEKATAIVRPLTGLSAGTHLAKLHVLGEITDGTGNAAVQLTMETYVDLVAQKVVVPAVIQTDNTTKTSNLSSSPKTGDDTNTNIFVISLISSLLIFVILLSHNRKQVVRK